LAAASSRESNTPLPSPSRAWCCSIATCPLEIDVSLAFLPFEHEAIAQAERMQVESTVLPVASVEDLLVYKAVASRERDQRDIRELLALYSGNIDLERVRRASRRSMLTSYRADRPRRRDADDRGLTYPWSFAGFASRFGWT
jgi:hypothetical protein